MTGVKGPNAALGAVGGVFGPIKSEGLAGWGPDAILALQNQRWGRPDSFGITRRTCYVSF